jgi:hypothetical protein
MIPNPPREIISRRVPVFTAFSFPIYITLIRERLCMLLKCQQLNSRNTRRRYRAPRRPRPLPPRPFISLPQSRTLSPASYDASRLIYILKRVTLTLRNPPHFRRQLAVLAMAWTVSTHRHIEMRRHSNLLRYIH